MTEQRKRDRWMQDIEDRQHNLVFPDTVQNEARFWRNLGSSPWTTATKVGVAILAVFVGGWLTTLLRITFQAHVTGWAVFWVLAIWGPIFAVLAWATRRSLRKIEEAKRGHRTRNR